MFSSEDYKYDVFISYARLDNQTGWVDEFHEELGKLLSSVLGRPAKIWRDKKKNKR